MIINNEVKNQYYNNHTEIKNENSYKKYNNENSIPNKNSFISEKKQQINNYSNFKSNPNVNINDKKFSPMTLPPKPSYANMKRPNSGNPTIRSNNINNNYNNLNKNYSNINYGGNQYNPNKVLKDNSFISEKGNLNNKINNNYDRGYPKYNESEVNEARTKLNNFYNEKSTLNQTNQNNSYYSNNSKTHNNYNNLNYANSNKKSPISINQRQPNNYSKTQNQAGNNFNYNNTNHNQKNNYEANKNLNHNNYNYAGYRDDLKNNFDNNKDYTRNNNNNNIYINHIAKEAANFSFHNNHMLESQVRNIDFNEFDQFSPPNNPNSNINYRETEEKEKLTLQNQKNFDSKLNYEHHRKNDANLLKNFADNLKSNINSNYYTNPLNRENRDYGNTAIRSNIYNNIANPHPNYDNFNIVNKNNSENDNYRLKYNSNFNTNYNPNYNSDPHIRQQNYGLINTDINLNKYKTNTNNIEELGDNEIKNANYYMKNKSSNSKIPIEEENKIKSNYISNMTKEITNTNNNNLYNHSGNSHIYDSGNLNKNYSFNPYSNNNGNYNIHNEPKNVDNSLNRNNNIYNNTYSNAIKDNKDGLNKINSTDYYSRDLKNPEQYKLDQNSKNYLMEKLNQMKSNETNSISNNNRNFIENNAYRPY